MWIILYLQKQNANLHNSADNKQKRQLTRRFNITGQVKSWEFWEDRQLNSLEVYINITTNVNVNSLLVHVPWKLTRDRL